MVTLWPWAAGVVLAAAVAVVVLALRRRPGDDVRWVARTEDLAAVPEVRRALRRAAAWRVGTAVAVGVGLVAGAVLVARPAERAVHTPRQSSRDIVLCLDVSGSMLPFDEEVVRTFRRLVDGFSGERIALSVFDSTSRTVFPLTDDYALVLDELEAAAQALSFDVEAYDPDDESTWDGLDRLLELLAGTTGVPDESSLVGDGLASCALLFDEAGSERSRSIVLATDNDVWGDPVHTLPQAVDVVAARDVGLYALHGGVAELRGSPQQAELADAARAAAGRTGHGGFWHADDPAVVDEILADVTAQQLAALDGRPVTVVTDRPWPWSAVLLGALVVVLVARWRTRS